MNLIERINAYFDTNPDLYRDEDHEEAKNLIQMEMLGFSLSGRPWDCLSYILGGLEIVANYRKGSFEDKQKAEIAHFGNRQAAHFFYYWALKEGLVDCGSLPACWLDAKGEELRALLREWKALWSAAEGIAS